jgi:hypothetical protein
MNVNRRTNWHSWLRSRGNLLLAILLVGGWVVALRTGAMASEITTSRSDSTDTIAYQGRLADSDGNPLTGTYDMTFKLYDVAAGGSDLWAETWSGGNAVQVNDGLFNVLLGSVSAIPQNVIEDNDTLWLGISVGADTEMLPRIQLGAVPFTVQSITILDGAITTEKIADEAVTVAKLDPDVELGINGWERDESSTSSPTQELQAGLLLQHGYAQHIVTASDVGNGFYDHYVPFPSPYQTGTIPTITFVYTGESAGPSDVPKGSSTNGTGENTGRLLTVTNAGFTIRGTGVVADRRHGFQWIAIGQP